ncbi:hypothetical protein CAP35_06190 [Chitinophagaceae bacterium IBVUCB1]|nr:hypothetical protein CAP35_06190 [Chitinophagaceae bacterium IBVUCB1]
MLEYYRLRIKKEYAASVIEDLQKMKAIEVISEDADVYEWQKKEVRKRVKELKKQPDTAVTWQAANKRIKALTK